MAELATLLTKTNLLDTIASKACLSDVDHAGLSDFLQDFLLIEVCLFNLDLIFYLKPSLVQ